MKHYLDMQIEEKKQNQKYERIVNDEQARIWQRDTNDFIEQEKDIRYKVYNLLSIKI